MRRIFLSALAMIFLCASVYAMDINVLVNSSNSILSNVTTQPYPFAHQSLFESLLLYYSFDLDVKPTTNTTYDYSRYNHDGRVASGTTQANLNRSIINWTSNAYIGGGWNFINQSWINISNNDDLHFNDTQPFFISLWLKTSATNTQTGIIGRGSITTTSSSVYNWKIEQSTSNRTTFSVGWGNGTAGSTGITSTANSLPMDTWTMITCGVNVSLKLQCYSNGLLNISSSAARVGGYYSNLNHTRIGRGSGTDVTSYKGLIDEVMIFNRSLNSSEVMQLYQLTYPKFYQPASHLLTSMGLGKIYDSKNTTNVFKAYYNNTLSSSGLFPPGTLPPSTNVAELNASDYNSISTSNNQYYNLTIPDESRGYILFNVSIPSQDVGELKAINWSWEGYYDETTVVLPDGQAKFYIWNFTSDSWNQCDGVLPDGTTDTVRSCYFDSGLDDLVDSSNRTYFFITADDPSDVDLTANYLLTDYVSLETKVSGFSFVNLTTNTTQLNGSLIRARILQYNFSGQNIQNTSWVDIPAGNNNVTVLNTSLDTSQYDVELNYTAGNFNYYSPTIQDAIILKTFNGGGGGNETNATCTYDCTATPVISSNVDCNNTHLEFTGSGTATLTATISNFNTFFISQCRLVINGGRLES